MRFHPYQFLGIFLCITMLYACSDGDQPKQELEPTASTTPPVTSQPNSPESVADDLAAESREQEGDVPQAVADPDVSIADQQDVVESVSVSPEIIPGKAPVAEQIPTKEQPKPATRTPQEFIVKGVVTQWQPLVLFAEVGDTVVFRQMSGHDTETIPELIPSGASGWKSKLGAEGFSVKLEQEGAYIYKCNPHAGTGMIGAIVVGKLPPENFPAITGSSLNKGMTGRAIRKLTAALEKKSGN